MGAGDSEPHRACAHVFSTGAHAGRVGDVEAGALLRHQAGRAVPRLHRRPDRPHQGARARAVP